MIDRSHLVGAAGVPYRFVVEEGKAREFARAVYASDPLFVDRAAAEAAGLPAPVVPPTFSVASAHWSVPGAMPDLQLDLRGVLAGGNEWEYLAPISVGDELEVTTSVESVEQKQSGRGPMVIITVRTDFRCEGELVQISRSTILQFDVKKEDGDD
ncbi:FAS1-like dehydratase domain-containing protein [Microbacterium sp. A82]|uniref:FAS1-like dehydratase domain-containing protein n=1 Tax=Microbacterium sp. A82 TaxID=3450452 RepID=UPI003F3A656B